MNFHRPSRTDRGSSLVLAMILLAVLMVIGVAAVRLGSVERINAAAKGKRDLLVACARAARMQIWTDLTRFGTGYMESTSPPPIVTLPDGSEIQAPSAPSYSSKYGAAVVDLVELVPMNSPQATPIRDITNTMIGGRMAGTSGDRFLARCKDAKGRELSVEINTKFAL